MKKNPLTWLVPLILLLLLIPFIVPSALPDAGAEEFDVPDYEPVELANPNPGRVLTEEVPWGKKATREKVLYGPHRNGFTTNEKGKNRGYLDGTISVKTDERTIDGTRVIFTWIQVADPSQIRAQFSQPYPSEGTAYPDKLAERERWVCALSGDSCTGIRAGTVIRNGKEYRKVDATRYDQLIIDNQGDFHVIRNPKTSDLDAYEGNILHSFIFGPALVVDGVLQELGVERDYGSSITFRKKAQRQVICQMDTLSYLIITTEGPEQSKNGGFTLYRLAKLAYETGAVTAYNLDGGCTTWLMLGADRVNNTNGRNLRPITDLIYFVTAEEDPEPDPVAELIAEPAAEETP